MDRDWKIIISLFAIFWCIVSAFAWQVYLSDKIGGGYFDVELLESDVPTQTIDKNKLHNDLLILEKSQAEFTRLKSGQGKMIDPSL